MASQKTWFNLSIFNIIFKYFTGGAFGLHGAGHGGHTPHCKNKLKSVNY